LVCWNVGSIPEKLLLVHVPVFLIVTILTLLPFLAVVMPLLAIRRDLYGVGFVLCVNPRFGVAIPLVIIQAVPAQAPAVIWLSLIVPAPAGVRVVKVTGKASAVIEHGL
jgi:hypothetical protein